jgi:excinuclease UvrABC helicase subunit UvrB
MKEAINETNKRRSIQDEYNVKNNITIHCPSKKVLFTVTKGA